MKTWFDGWYIDSTNEERYFDTITGSSYTKFNGSMDPDTTIKQNRHYVYIPIIKNKLYYANAAKVRSFLSSYYPKKKIYIIPKTKVNQEKTYFIKEYVVRDDTLLLKNTLTPKQQAIIDKYNKKQQLQKGKKALVDLLFKEQIQTLISKTHYSKTFNCSGLYTVTTYGLFITPEQSAKYNDEAVKLLEELTKLGLEVKLYKKYSPYRFKIIGLDESKFSKTTNME